MVPMSGARHRRKGDRLDARFGAPTTPIIVRRSHTYEEEAPATETAT
jgi:hypothetical protein